MERGLINQQPFALEMARRAEQQKMQQSAKRSNFGQLSSTPPMFRPGLIGSVMESQPMIDRRNAMGVEMVMNLMPGAGLFAGVNSKLANLGKLAQAKSLRSQGSDRNSILQETGWFKDHDGAWKFEIDDSMSNFTERGNRALKDYEKHGIGANMAEHTTNNMYNHPELEYHYPLLYNQSSTKLDPRMAPNSGAFNRFGYPSTPEGKIQVHPGNNARSVQLHELQHGIQEGAEDGMFAHGSNTLQSTPGEVKFAKEELVELVGALKIRKVMKSGGVDAETAAWRVKEQTGIFPESRSISLAARPLHDDNFLREQIKKWDKKHKTALASMNKSRKQVRSDYHNSAGEAEARNVEYRKDFTPEQRLKRHPLDTLDVKPEDLIINLGLPPV